MASKKSAPGFTHLTAAQITRIRSLVSDPNAFEGDTRALEFSAVLLSRATGDADFGEELPSGPRAGLPGGPSFVHEMRRRLAGVCKRYCATRERFSGDSVALACNLADAFISFQFRFPAPVTSVAVYLVRNGIMDNMICQCDKEHW